MISQAGGQLALNTAFSTPDPAYYYRVTVKDANGDVIASYEGTDAQIVLQPVGVLESVTYTSLGSFRGGPYVYAEYVYHVFAGTVSGLTETEAVNAVTISGTTNLPQAGFDTTLRIYVTLNASSATSGGQVTESELQYDSSGHFTYTQALAYATQSYRYRLTFSGKNGEEKEMYSSDLIPLNVSHAYGGSYTRISADEAHILAAQTQDGSVTFQSGFSATDPAFIYRVSLKNPTGATVAQYSGSASQITLTPTGEWSSIVYESVGLFEPEYVYETFASDPFAGSLTNMDVTEDVTALVFSASTNLHQAGFDTQPGIRVTLTGNEEKSEGASSADTGDSGFGTTLEFTEDLTILQDGSFELRFPIYFTTESYTYEIFYTDSAGQEGILAQGGDEITLSHYPQNLTFTWPDMDDLEVLYVNSTDGSVSLDMGSAGTSAFGYRMQFFDQNGSLILEKTGTEQNCTCQLTDLPYSVTCYYVGFFRDTVRYPATNAYLHVPYVYVEEDSTPYGYVSFTGFCDFPYLSYPTEATVELTLNGATSQTVEEPLEYDQDGNFSFQSLVYQDTQSYSYKIYYLSKAGVKRECYSSETLTYTPLNGFDAEYDRPTADDLSESGHDENVPINLTTNFSSNRSILFYRVKLLDDNGNVLASYEGTDPSIVLNPVGTWTSVRYSSVGAFRSEYVFAEYTYTIFVPTAGTPQKTEYFNRIELDMDSNFHEAPYDLDVRIRYTLTVPPEMEYDTAGLNVTEPLEWDDEGHISFAIPLRMDASAYSYTVYYYDRAQLYQELVSEQGVTLSYSREEDPGYPYYTLSDADVVFGEEGTCTISIPSDPEAAENGFYIIYYLYKEGGENLGFATTLDGNAVFENVELPNTLYLQGFRSCDFTHTVSDYGQIDGLQEQLVTLDIPWVELDESGNLNGDGTISVPFEILSEQTVPDTYQSVEFTLSYDDDSETVVSADVTGSTGTLVIPKVPGSGRVLVSQAVLHAEGAFGGHERIVEMPVESSYEWPLTMSAELLYVQVEETGPVVPVFHWSREGAGSEDASLKIRDTSTQETDLSVISESPGIVYFYPDNGAITSGTHVLECYLIDAQQDAMTDPVYFTVNADVNGSDRIFTFEEPESTSVLTTYNADGTVNLYMDLGFTTDDPDLFLCGSIENYETGNLGETVKTTNRVLALEDLPVDVSGIRFGVGLTVDGVDYWIRNGMYEFSGFAEPGFIGMTLSQNGLSIDLYEDERVAYDADSVFISADGGTPVAVTFEPGPNEGVLYFFSSDAQFTQAQSVTLTIPANNYAAGYESITALTTVKGNLLTPMTLVATQD
ncbi:MAG: hypothetical protein IKS35_04895 [Clostridia bacterium]|nr:hypothetical protein [Clostridia bacterium]